MANIDNNDGIDNNKTIHRRAKAWDGTIASEAEIVFKTNSAFEREKIRFDGSNEKMGSTDEDIKTRIASCREAYEHVGIIGNIIDLMVDFGIEGIEVYHKSKPIERFFKHWTQKVGLREFAEQVLKCLYRDGNVPVMSYHGTINQEETDRFKRSLSKKILSEVFEEEIEKGNKKIPYKYKILDVMNVKKYGSEILGDVNWIYQYNKKECNTLATKVTSNDKIKKLKESMTDEQWDLFAKQGLISLDPKFFSMLYYKKDSYKSWANPMLWRVMDDVKFKKLIRDMDISVAEGVTNALTLVKLGDIKAGIPPSKKKYDKLIEMLKNPSKAKTIVWDDLISIETVFPPVKDFFSAEKYEQVDNDIRSGLGIAEILVNGGGGNYSNSFLSVKTLLERLETGRQILLEFLNEEIVKVTKSMGFRSAPYIRLTNMSLTNEETEKKFILELFDRNAISFETLLNRFGENLEIEKQRIIEEDKEREKLKEESPFALLRVGKFGPQYQNGPPSLYDLTNPNQIQTPFGQEKKGDLGGSPTGPKNRKKRSEPADPVGEVVASKKIQKKDK